MKSPFFLDAHSKTPRALVGFGGLTSLQGTVTRWHIYHQQEKTAGFSRQSLWGVMSFCLIHESPCRVRETRQPAVLYGHTNNTFQQDGKKPLHKVVEEEKVGRKEVYFHTLRGNIRPGMWLLQPRFLDKSLVFTNWCQVFKFKFPPCKSTSGKA